VWKLAGFRNGCNNELHCYFFDHSVTPPCRYLARCLRARDAGLSLPVVLELELHRLRAGVKVNERDDALGKLKVYPEELDPKTYLHARRVKRWEVCV
jgi:hypothetical protein